MKRLITFFITFIACFSLWGQDIPMTVVGDVYVDAGGKMESVGSVHLQASYTSKIQARVENHGEIKMDTAAVFYSDDLTDGLLMNLNGNSVTAKSVVLRKTFSIVNNGGKGYFYQFSLPFDVDVATGIVSQSNADAGTHAGIGQVMKNATFPSFTGDVLLQTYDIQKRANRGLNDYYDWVPTYPDLKPDIYGNHPYSDAPAPITTLKKGVGYQIFVDTDYPDNTVIDFVGAPGNFLAQADKQQPLDWYAHNPSAPFGRALNPDSVEWVQGWNPIGGLNSTYFLFNSATPTYSYSGITNTIYYIDNTLNGNTGKYKELSTLPAVKDTATLRPYSRIWVRATGMGASFTYKAAGLRIDSLAGPMLLRSAQAASDDDIIGLFLSKSVGANPNDASRILFRFGAYSKDIKGSEDDIRLTTESNYDPIVWSVSAPGSAYPLFLNSLPVGENIVPIGVNIPAAGDYVFSLKEYVNTTVKDAYLVDNLDPGNEVDLLTGEKTVNFSSAYNGDARFVLHINKVITSVDPVNTADIYAYTDNNILTVKNLHQGDVVQVLDLTGRIIASGTVANNTFSATLMQKGVYIVNVKGIKTLKVLNK